MKQTKGLKNSGRKKTAVGEAAPAPVALKPAALAAATVEKKAIALDTGNGSAHRSTVTIEAKIDVGFGNALFLRGEGLGLSWERGLPLMCVDGTTWKWTAETEEAMKFKLLINDAVWSKGEDLVAAPGQRLQIAPSF